MSLHRSSFLRTSVSLSLLFTSTSEAQDRRAGPPAFRLDEVVPGVYAAIEPREWALSPMVHGNTMFVVNERDVFAVDANRTPSAARKTLDLLRTKTSNPVRTLLITHVHGDHWLGIQAFREAFPSLRVISTDSARSAMFPALLDAFPTRPDSFYTVIANRYDSIYNAGVDLAGRPLTPERRRMFEDVRSAFRDYYAIEAPTMKLEAPELTFDRSLRIRSDKRVIDLLFVGEGDTPGDAVAWLPAERVLATGDMLVHPVPYAGSAVPSQWAKSLRAVRALGPRHIVPGHGEVQHGTEYLDLVIETIEATVAEVRRHRARGVSLEAMPKRVTMEKFRDRMVPRGDAAAQNRWDDFLGALIGTAYAETSKR